MAIILWDELKYVRVNNGVDIYDVLPNDMDVISKLNNIILPVGGHETIDKLFESRSFDMEDAISRYSGLDLSMLYGKDGFIERTQAYLLQSNLLETNCLLHPLREAHIAEVLSHDDVFYPSLNRLNLMYHIDEQAKEIVKDINKKFGGDMIQFKYPLLYKYIKSNASSKKEELEIALKIREENSVKKFRKSLDDLDKHINNYDLLPINDAIKSIEEITNSIIKNYDKKITIGSYKILPRPSITIEGDITFPAHRKRLHLTFLKKVIKSSLVGK